MTGNPDDLPRHLANRAELLDVLAEREAEWVRESELLAERREGLRASFAHSLAATDALIVACGGTAPVPVPVPDEVPEPMPEPEPEIEAPAEVPEPAPEPAVETAPPADDTPAADVPAA